MNIFRRIYNAFANPAYGLLHSYNSSIYFLIIIILPILLIIPAGILKYNPEYIDTVQKYFILVILIATVLIGLILLWENGRFEVRNIPCFLVSLFTVFISKNIIVYIWYIDTEDTSLSLLGTIVLFCIPVLICGVLLGILSRRILRATKYETLMICMNIVMVIVLGLLSNLTQSGYSQLIIYYVIFCYFAALIYLIPMLLCCLPYALIKRL